jgi:hypothetical protein
MSLEIVSVAEMALATDGRNVGRHQAVQMARYITRHNRFDCSYLVSSVEQGNASYHARVNFTKCSESGTRMTAIKLCSRILAACSEPVNKVWLRGAVTDQEDLRPLLAHLRRSGVIVEI